MNCAADWQMILEYLKVLLSWPPMVALLVLGLLPKFGSPLSNLIGRIRKGKAPGFEFEADQENLQSKVPTPVNAGDHLTTVSADPILARAEILKWWVAASSENIFHKIFGTQIRMLEYLLSKEPSGEVEANLEPFFAEHKKLVEATPMPVVGSNDWGAFIGFLKANSLIFDEHRDGTKYVRISDLGRQFLQYTKATWGAYASTRIL